MKNCEIPRWQLLKTELNNLSYSDFLKKLTTDPNPVCLDVRTAEEYSQGHLPNSVNINYLSTSLADDLEMLDKSKNYYVYCRTGRRSLRVCIILQNAGYKVVNMDVGLQGQVQGKKGAVN